MSDPKIKIFLASEEEFTQQALWHYISSTQHDFHVVGLAPVNHQLLNRLEEFPVDILLLDVKIHHLKCQGLIKTICGRFPLTKIIAISNCFTEAYVREIFSLGVTYFLHKNAKLSDVINTIQMVSEQEYELTRHVTAGIINDLCSRRQKYLLAEKSILSQREVEVLQMISDGLTYKEIGATLYISTNTVKFHLKSLYRKTQLNSVANLVKYAIILGIIDPEAEVIQRNQA